MTRGGGGGVQEVQLAAPRSTGGVTDNQHGEGGKGARGREEEAAIQKRGGDERGVWIREGRGEEKRWSLPKWVVMPHLSIPCCHTPSPTPQEF